MGWFVSPRGYMVSLRTNLSSLPSSVTWGIASWGFRRGKQGFGCQLRGARFHHGLHVALMWYSRPFEEGPHRG